MTRKQKLRDPASRISRRGCLAQRDVSDALPPPVPAIVTDELAVASPTQVMTPPVLPMPMLRVFACSVLVPEPRNNVDIPPSLLKLLLPTSISAPLMVLVGLLVPPRLLSARVSTPELLIPNPMLTVLVVLIFTLFSPEKSTVVVVFPARVVAGLTDVESPRPAHDQPPPPVAVRAPV